MRKLNFIVAALLLGATSLQALAETEVKFVRPLGFDDIGNHDFGTDEVLSNVVGLGRAMIQRADFVLKPGQEMRFVVTNVHLAGTELPWRPGMANGSRIYRPNQPPSMTFSFVVFEGGKAVREGSAEITDINFADRFNRYYKSDPLFYERQMLDEWFGETFGVKVEVARRL